MNELRQRLLEGMVIPACPLALDSDGRWSERHQGAVLDYYREAGAGGIAVGVHTTQFEIREPQVGLYEPVLEFASDRVGSGTQQGMIKVAGICGETALKAGSHACGCAVFMLTMDYKDKGWYAECGNQRHGETSS